MGKEFKNLGQICKAKQVIGACSWPWRSGFPASAPAFLPCLARHFHLPQYVLDSGSLSHPFPGLNFTFP